MQLKLIKVRLNTLTGIIFIHLLIGIVFFNLNDTVAQDVRVLNEESEFLSFPWAGGLNAVQFGEIDLNFDGLNDLFVFDRHGNRKLCFINNGVYNNVSYSFRPEYADSLPDLSDWAIFIDYNGDGRNDIFTYSPGWAGMKVYQNVSDNSLKFKLVADPYLKSLYGEMYLNLYVSDVDYPGIADVDDDGDLDILSFWVLGSFVNYHRNMSMEKYGTADSLDFELQEYCWGMFAESDESNKIYLDTCFNQQPFENMDFKQTRHSGSTFLLLDLNQDTIKDLLLGDVDYPGLFSLINDGTRYHAHIGSYDTLFPKNSEKVDLFSFPVAAYIDVNNDTKKDLLVSTFDPQLITSENKNSVWDYNNSGGNDKPFFNLTSKNFLQSQMIDRGSGAYPALFDWDGDGLTDLFIGNFGFYRYSYYDNYTLISVYQSKIGYYKNTGTSSNPEFQFSNDDFAGLSVLNKTGLSPTFGDLDGDGDPDILVGYDAGKIIFAENKGNNFDLSDTSYFNIDVGDYSAPQLFDLDKDGRSDLIIGEQSGNLNYYRNEGTEGNPDFVYITDSLGKVRVTDIQDPYHGYSTPWFFRDASDVTHLVVGSEDGLIFYYTNIDGNLDGTFTKSDGLADLLDTTGVSFDRGIRTAAAIADISNNGQPEMIAGNFSGGLEYFNGNADVSPGIVLHPKNKKGIIKIFPNPAGQQISFRLDAYEHDIRSASILNINGKTVIRDIRINNKNQIHTIDIAGLSNGVYLLKVIGKTSIFTGRFLVMNNIQ